MNSGHLLDRDITEDAEYENGEVSLEGGNSDGEEECEGKGGEGGEAGLPVGAEGVGEGGQGEVEKAKQAG